MLMLINLDGHTFNTMYWTTPATNNKVSLDKIPALFWTLKYLHCILNYGIYTVYVVSEYHVSFNASK